MNWRRMLVERRTPENLAWVLLSTPLDAGGPYLPYPGLLGPGSTHRPGYKSTLVPAAEERLGPNQSGSEQGRLQRVL